MIRNIIANVIGRLWGTLSNFIFIPLYINYLGFSSYSVISFTLIIAGLMAVLDSGITATLSRELARQDKCWTHKKKTFKTLEYIYYGIVILSIVVLSFTSEYISQKFISSKVYSVAEIAYLIKIISFDIAFQLLFRFYLGGIFGLDKQVRANVYQVGWGGLRNGLVIFAVMISPTLDVFFIWQAVSSFTFSIIARRYLYKILFNKSNDPKFKFELNIIKEISAFACGMFFISLVAAINAQLDKLAISALLPNEILGYYTLCVSISVGLLVLVNPFATALLPKFTSLYTTGDSLGASLLFHKYIKIVAIIVFSFMSNMIFNTENILWIWTGDSKLANIAAIYLPLLLFAYAMLALAVIPFAIAVSNGYTKINVTLGLFSLIITLPGYWIGSKLYGALGAASIYCIVQTVVTLIYFYLIDAKFIKGKMILKFYFMQLLLPLSLSVFLAFICNYIPNWYPISRLWSLLEISTEILFCIIISMLIFAPSSLTGIYNRIYNRLIVYN